MTTWNTTYKSKRYPYFRSAKEEWGDERINLNELKCELAALIRRAQVAKAECESECSPGILKLIRKAEELCKQCHQSELIAIKRKISEQVAEQLKAEHGNAGTLFGSPVNHGAIRYEQAHPNGTPKELNASYNAKAEVAKADGNAARLIKMHGYYNGADPDSAKSYSYPHHAGDGSQGVFKSAVVALAKQLNISGESGSGTVPTKQETANAQAGLLSHIARHLSELS
jgi:hypothetical protein